MLRAGILAVALLVASRLLGLVRDLVIAHSFGVSATADAVVLLTTLPDLVAGLLGGSAVHLALIPLWHGTPPDQLPRSHAAALRLAWMGGAAAAVVLVVLASPVVRLLAPGIPPELQGTVVGASRLVWMALPAALASSVLGARSLFMADAVGTYSAALVLTAVVIAGLFAVGIASTPPEATLWVVAGVVLVAYLARYGWQRRRHAWPPVAPSAWHGLTAGFPPAFWRSMSTGWLAMALPALLPVIARSWISSRGSGLLATFGYAAKLVEMANQFGAQLVATLAVTGLGALVAARKDVSGALATAASVSWAMACAAAATLWAAGEPLARMLFLRGAVAPEDAARIGEWTSLLSLGLCFQSLSAVVSVVIANRGAFRWMAASYGLALGLVFVWPWLHPGLSPASIMLAVVGAQALVAVMMLVWLAHARRTGSLALGTVLLPWRELAAVVLACATVAAFARSMLVPMFSTGFAGSTAAVATSAGLALLACLAGSPTARRVLRRQS